MCHVISLHTEKNILPLNIYNQQNKPHKFTNSIQIILIM